MHRFLPVLVGMVLVLAGVAQGANLPGFHSPSRNISCLLVPGPPRNVQCQIVKADYARTLEARCTAGGGVDWHGFTLTASKPATIVCSGGILYNPTAFRPQYEILAYGERWRRGVFTCVSRVTGVTCQNRTGHGFFLSRQSWRVW